MGVGVTKTKELAETGPENLTHEGKAVTPGQGNHMGLVNDSDS
jgi:hypothetical protein